MQTYPYKPRPLIMLLACGFFAACAPIMANIAMTNDRDLIIDGLIRLDPGQATIVFWGLFACSIILALGGFAGFLRALTSRHVLVLGNDSFQIPKSPFASAILVVAYKDITGLTRLQIKSQHFLTVHYTGRKLNIASSMLASRATFEEVCETIAAHVKALQSRRA